jgi:hypothetical protein
MVVVDPSNQCANLLRHQVVDRHRDAASASRIDEGSRLFDRFRPVHLGTRRSCRPSSAIHGRSSGAQLDGYSPTRSTRRAGDQRNLPHQGFLHG